MICAKWTCISSRTVTNGGKKPADAVITFHYNHGQGHYGVEQTITPGEKLRTGGFSWTILPLKKDCRRAEHEADVIKSPNILTQPIIIISPWDLTATAVAAWSISRLFSIYLACQRGAFNASWRPHQID